MVKKTSVPDSPDTLVFYRFCCFNMLCCGHALCRTKSGERSVGYAEIFLDGGNLLCGLGVATGVAACTLHCALYLKIELDLGLCA